MTRKFYTDENLFFPGVQPVTRSLLEAVFYDAPLTSAAIAGFGLETPDHYQTLRYAIQVTDVHPMEIDAMVGDGAKLTAWVNDTGYNRSGVVYRTARDVLREGERIGAQDNQATGPIRDQRRQTHRQRDREQER